MFQLMLTDNDSEFADEAAVATLLGETAGETKLYYCGGRRAGQKGGCEKNRVELRNAAQGAGPQV